MPGQEKIFSTSTAPVSTFAKTSPSTVTTDGSAAAQDVPQDDHVARAVPSPGRTHVVVADDLEHRCAGEAGQQADVNGQHEPRQQQVVQADQNSAHCPCTAASIVYIPVSWVGGFWVGSRRPPPGNQPSLKNNR